MNIHRHFRRIGEPTEQSRSTGTLLAAPGRTLLTPSGRPMKHPIGTLAACVVFAGPGFCEARTFAGSPVLAERHETVEQHDARMAWWRVAAVSCCRRDHRRTLEIERLEIANRIKPG